MAFSAAAGGKNVWVWVFKDIFSLIQKLFDNTQKGLISTWYLHGFKHLLMHSASASNLLALPPQPPYQPCLQILVLESKNHTI